MSKFLYPIKNLKIETWIKYWLEKRANELYNYELSEILSGITFYLPDSSNKKFKIFAIEGNTVQDGTPTVDNPVERYSAGANGSITEKIVNKNWFDGVVEEGGLNSGQNATSSTNLIRSKNYSAVKPNTQYVFSVNGTLNKVVMNYYDINKNWINTGTAAGELCDTGIFTTPENAHYVRFRCYAADYNLFSTGNIQIELGSTATPYTEHKEQTYTMPVQQEMRSIGTVRDEFVKKNDVWYERHNIARVIFDGTETFVLELSNEEIKQFRTPQNFLPNLLITPDPFDQLGNSASNYFIKLSNANALTDKGFTLNGNKQVIFNTEFTTVAELKAWLAEQYANGTPVYVDYILATPTDLPCTQAQIDVLENLPSTYNGGTNIISLDSVPANLKIQYWKEK